MAGLQGTSATLPRPACRGAPSLAAKRPAIPGCASSRSPSALIVLLPVLSLAYVALSGTGEDWPHLVRNVLPGASATTLCLMAMVAAGDLGGRRRLGLDGGRLRVSAAPDAVLGAGAAAGGAVLSRRLRLRRVLRLFRAGAGRSSGRCSASRPSRDYWFPGHPLDAGLRASCCRRVLYPYVYLTTRIVFLMQGRNIADVARTLGARPAKVFWRVLLPVARPAIVAGVALVLMETINDIGAAEYLGVRTLTVAVYTTWLNRGSLEGGAQIALLMLVLVFAAPAAEQWARRRQRFHTGRATHMKAHPPRVALKGLPGAAGDAADGAAGALRLRHPDLGVRPVCARAGSTSSPSPDLGEAFLNSLMTAGCTALLTVVLALFLLNAVRLARSHGVTATVRLASIGYALPGGILGLGLLFVLARFDNTLDALFRACFEHLDRPAADRLGGGASSSPARSASWRLPKARSAPGWRSCRRISTRRRAASARRRRRVRRPCCCRC